MKILFVCAGNTCRSPMAEALANQMAQEMGFTDCSFASAGTHVWPGDVASRDTVSEMVKRGIQLEGRKAQQLNADLAQGADLILTMTAGVSNAVISILPQFESKVLTLPQYVGEDGDVDDPYGCGEEVYHETAEQICRLLKKLFALFDKNARKGEKK